MMIHGGIDDEEEKILNDSYILDLLTFTWSKADIKSTKIFSLAYHASTLVLQAEKRDHPQVTVYKVPDLPSSKTGIKKVIFLFLK